MTTPINTVAAKSFERDLCYPGGPTTLLKDWCYTVSLLFHKRPAASARAYLPEILRTVSGNMNERVFI